MVSVTALSVVFGIIALVLYKIKKAFNGPATPLARSMDGKTIVITGADSSIGFETAKTLLSKGAKVIFACRNEKKTNEQINSLPHESKKRAIFIKLDLTDYDSILHFVEEIKSKVGKIDILLNNAGTCFQKFQAVQGIEKTLFTNYIGHLILTVLLLNLFNPKGRVINVSTTKYKRVTQYKFNNFISNKNYGFELTKKNYKWMQTYVMSKLTNILHTVYLGDYFSKNNLDLKAAVVHPGFVQNEFFRDIHYPYWTFRQIVMIPFRWLLFKDISMGAQTHLHACYIDYDNLVNGGYYKDCQHEILKPIARKENAFKLMNFTEQILLKNNIVKNNEQIVQFFK